MTIHLTWPSQASKGLTSIEIYRKAGWNATLDVNNPGTPIATLAGTAVEFIDDIATLTKNTTYRYWIAGVKGTERLIGNPVTQGFFPDTGPGPQTLKRGDWACGYFGTLTNAEFFNRQELQLLLNTQQAGMFTTDPTTWHKFVFRGRIIFFPATYHSNTNSVLMAYQRGMMYGTDDNGTLIPTGATATKQDCKVTKDGRSYRIRLPYAVPYDAAGSGQDYVNGEWRNTFARLFPVSTAFSTAGAGSFDSLTVMGSTASVTDPGAAAQAPLYAAGNLIYAYGYAPSSLNVTSGVNTAATLFFVFELILP